MKKVALIVALLAVVLSVSANAATIGPKTIGTEVDANISGNVTWTKAGAPYYLVGDVYVLPGASLTIEAGVVVASYVNADGALFGSLAVCQDADIYVMGTEAEPVIMTSANDVATWKGSIVTLGGDINADGYDDVTDIIQMGDPKTGTWRPVCKEWGSLAIMGNGYIGYSYDSGNQCPSGSNIAKMEGLTADYVGDPKVLYGGSDDNDDSGEIHYLSLRYGGRDTEPQKELNGMSLGAIGRATDIDHVEIMNNVDDGIEIWGGTIELSFVNIWNIGDDSLDADQGWRGSVENALIVQGYCAETAKSKIQGSGVGDNCIEIDGAEDCDAQPVTTVRISKVTVVGQPGDDNSGGDGGTAWRDNARVQYDNCLWMDLDDELVKYDCQDGDGAGGYDGDHSDGTKIKDNTPADNTLGWDQHWTTSYQAWTANPISVEMSNDCSSTWGDISHLYDWTSIDKSSSARLCQITNSVFYNVGMTEYNRLAALDPVVDTHVTGYSNLVGNQEVISMPIRTLIRDDVYTVSFDKDYDMQVVKFINPLPVAGVTAGAFASCNWLASWTAADAYGLTDTSMNGASADLNCDGSVDLDDLAALSSQWLQ